MSTPTSQQAHYMPTFFGGVFMGMILMIAVLVFTDTTYRDGYKQGQIDAYTGNWKYRLAVQPDSTKIWEKIIK